MSDKHKDRGALIPLPDGYSIAGGPGGKPFYTVAGRNISVDGVEVDKTGRPLGFTCSDSYTRQRDLVAAQSELAVMQKQLGERWSEISAFKETVERQEGELAALREELADMQRWRDLALQFDHHRMTALWHLKTLVINPGYSPAVTDFLADPPLPAHEVVQRLTAAEQRNAELVELLQAVRPLHGYSKGLIDRVDAALKPTESGASDA